MEKGITIKYCIGMVMILWFLGFIPQVQAAKPAIWYQDIINGPTSGGEDNNGAYLTLTGTDFGVPVNNLPPATTHVYINGIEIADYKYLGQMRGRPNAWQLAVQVGDVTSGVVSVTTPEGTAMSEEFFTVNNGDMIYVAVTGNDTTGDGSFGNPYRSVKKGLNTVTTATDNSNGGDHIIIRGGDYNLVTDAVANGVNHGAWIYISHPMEYGVTNATISGRPNNHITVMGYPGEDPRGNYETSDSSFRGIRTYTAEKRPYWVFSNITIDLGVGGAYATLWGYCGPCSGTSANDSNSDHARFINITVKNGMSSCDGNGGFNQTSWQSADDLKIYGLDIGDQSSGTLPTCGSHMMYVSHRHANADIAYCYIHDNNYGGRAALQLAGDTAENYYADNINVQVHHNYFKNLPDAGILLGRGSYQNKIYNNLFENMQVISHEGFAAIALRGGGGEAIGDYEFYNNTIYSDVQNTGLIQIGYSPELSEYPNSVIIRNNIIYAKSPTTAYYTFNHASFDPYTMITADHNLYYNSTTYNYLVGSPHPAFSVVPDWENDAVSASPQFVALTDFQLQSTSPAINSGLTLSSVITDFLGTSRPQGSAYDIGAYEYQETGVVIRADVDQSSSINSTDALLTLRNSLGLNMSSTNWQISSTTGDVNCDDFSSSTDALLILRESLGLDMTGTGWCG